MELYETQLTISESGRVEFTEIVQSEGMSKTELLERFREWISGKEYDLESVEVESDEQQESFSISGFILIPVKSLGVAIDVELRHKLTVIARNGGYKAIITEIRYAGDVNCYPYDETEAEIVIVDKALYKANGNPRRLRKLYKEETIKAVEQIFDSIENALRKSNYEPDDDW